MIIALLTDFGTRDSYVGMLKGVLLSHCPTATLVDLGHEIPPQDILRGALSLLDSARYLPAATVTLAVVDPGVGSSRRILAAQLETKYYVAPDNGLLDPLLQNSPAPKVVSVARPDLYLPHISNTFQGRDLMAPVAAALAKGEPLASLGKEITDWQRLPLPCPVIGSGEIVGEILYADNFGNLPSNITVETIQKAKIPLDAGSIIIDNRARGRMVSSYAEAEPDSLCGIINSASRLEIAVPRANAAARLQYTQGQKLTVRLIR